MTYQPPSSPPSIKEAMKTIDSMLDDSPTSNDMEIGGSTANGGGLQGGHPVDIMPNNKLTPTFNSKGKFQSYEQTTGTTPTTNSNDIQDALTLANQIESSPYGFHFDKKSKVDIKEEIKKKEEDRKKKEQEVALQQMLANPRYVIVVCMYVCMYVCICFKCFSVCKVLGSGNMFCAHHMHNFMSH